MSDTIFPYPPGHRMFGGGTVLTTNKPELPAPANAEQLLFARIQMMLKHGITNEVQAMALAQHVQMMMAVGALNRDLLEATAAVERMKKEQTDG